MKRLLSATLFGAAVGLHAAGWSQEAKVMEPPPILKITKLVAKPGKLSGLIALERERAAALKSAHWPRSSIASSSITGVEQIWVMARYSALGDLAADHEVVENTPSLKSAEERIDNAETELLESRRDITATYQKDISYRPAFDWSEVRYWEIIWVHLRTGHHEAYIDNRTMTREEHEKGAYDTHQMMYAVQSGEPSGTFMVIRPMKTLALLDDLHAHNDGEPVTPEQERRKVQLFAESGMSEEEAYFKIDPKMTYVPQ